MLPTVEPWVVPGENVDNPGGIPNVNPLDTLSSDLHEWGGRVRSSPMSSVVPIQPKTREHTQQSFSSRIQPDQSTACGWSLQPKLSGCISFEKDAAA